MEGEKQSPGLLWIFGESGVSILGVIIEVDDVDRLKDDYDWESHPQIVRARELFPEAEVSFGLVESANKRKAIHTGGESKGTF